MRPLLPADRRWSAFSRPVFRAAANSRTTSRPSSALVTSWKSACLSATRWQSAECFVYAVTMTGTTGNSAGVPDDVLAYMDRVKRCSTVPVCAGFGIRSRDQVARLGAHVDGVVVGSALVEALERGDDVKAFLGSLR